MFILIALGVLALAGIVATVVAVARDGYRARPDLGDPRRTAPRRVEPAAAAAQPVVAVRLG